jgi:preprotein translocase subunit SecA
MGKIYDFLGLSVGCIVGKMQDEDRKIAYNADITHCTNNELGFDYLRDNMKFAIEQKVQREFAYAIVDEVDSILIDEARTPLIISGPVSDNTEIYQKIDLLVTNLTPEEYDRDEKLRTVNLNEDGINKIEELLRQNKIIEENSGLYDFDNMYLVHYVSQALRAHILFNKDVDYLLKDNKVMIIDEFTGRIMDGRRYSEGLHQALEAKEHVEIQNENQTLASITFQNYFRLYDKLAGMTGTAMTEAPELKDIYNLDVVAVPTHHQVKRKDHDDEIYGNKKDKYEAILNQIRTCHTKGQPVLVGTISIEKSEELAELLKKNNIPHNVLNAKFHEQEAHIIAQAGRFGSVTIATNMAGRGTDIMLGGNPEMLLEQMGDIAEKDRDRTLAKIKSDTAIEKQKVKDAGGLFIIGTERHESRRIDNQLRGRSGRQGDPGETKFYLSLDDDLMRIFASERVSGILRTLGLKDGEAIHHPMISRSLEKAQQKVEGHHYDTRKNLLKFDDVMNDQRKVVYAQRNEIMLSETVEDSFIAMADQVIESTVIRFIPHGVYREEWDIEGLIKESSRIFDVEIPEKMISESDINEEGIIQNIKGLVRDLYAKKEKEFGKEMMNNATRYILLNTLDQVWKDHLHYLDHLRQGISLRAYGQKDPLNEYKREAFALFEKMLDQIQELFVARITHLYIDSSTNQDMVRLTNRKLENIHETREDPAFQRFNTGTSVEVPYQPAKAYIDPKDRVSNDPSSWGKIARNESCPCGSGKKYKHCHGKA